MRMKSLALVLTVLFGCTFDGFAAPRLPAAEPADIQSLQTCLGSRVENLAPTCIGIVAEGCLPKADSQQRITHCMVREHAVWDLFLNNDYNALMVGLNHTTKSELQGIEREFLGATNRRCAFIGKIMGYASAVQGPDIERCWYQAKAIQWLWLRDFVSDLKRKP